MHTHPPPLDPTNQSIDPLCTYVPMHTHAAFCTAIMRDPGPPPPLSASDIYGCVRDTYMCVRGGLMVMHGPIPIPPAALCVCGRTRTPHTKPTNTPTPATHTTQKRTRKDFILAARPAPAPSECAHPIPLIAADAPSILWSGARRRVGGVLVGAGVSVARSLAGVRKRRPVLSWGETDRCQSRHVLWSIGRR